MVNPPGWKAGDYAAQIVVDPNDYQHAFFLDENGRVFETIDAGSSTAGWSEITDNLTTDLTNGNRINYISFDDFPPSAGPNNGVLLAGTLFGQVFRRFGPDPQGVSWHLYGLGLPDVQVSSVDYAPQSPWNPAYGDVVLVGTLGRGAWTVPYASNTLYTPGSLEIDGDEGGVEANDTIVLRLDPNNSRFIQAIVNGNVEYDGPYSPFQTITIDGGLGKDSIDVEDVPAGIAVTTVESGASDGSHGAAAVVGKNGSVSGIQGSVNVTDPPDYLTLTVDDSADPATPAVTVTNGEITGLAPGTIYYDQAEMSALNIETGTGRQTIAVQSTPDNIFGITTTFTDHGPKTVVVGDNGNVQGIRGTLVFTNPPRSDSLDIDDSADRATGHTVTIDTSTIGGRVYGRIQGLAAGGTIEFRIGDVNSPVQVQTGSGGNMVNVLATFAAISVIGHGLDTVTVGNGGSLQGIQGNVSVSDPPSYTALIVDDSADKSKPTLTMTNAEIDGLAPAGAKISYTQGDLRSLTVEGGIGGDIENIQSIPDHGSTGSVVTSLVANGPVTVNVGNAGSVQGIAGTLSLTGPPGSATLRIDDSADTQSRTVTVTRGAVAVLGAGPIEFTQSNLASLSLQTGRGGGTVTVASTPNNSLGVTTTITGHGPIGVLVGSNGSVQGIAGTLVLANQPNADSLTVDDSTDQGGAHGHDRHRHHPRQGLRPDPGPGGGGHDRIRGRRYEGARAGPDRERPRSGECPLQPGRLEPSRERPRGGDHRQRRDDPGHTGRRQHLQPAG